MDLLHKGTRKGFRGTRGGACVSVLNVVPETVCDYVERDGRVTGCLGERLNPTCSGLE